MRRGQRSSSKEAGSPKPCVSLRATWGAGVIPDRVAVLRVVVIHRTFLINLCKPGRNIVGPVVPMDILDKNQEAA
jgi:hypothetical protein